MQAALRRLARERRTIEVMIALYCRDVHGAGSGPCADCEGLRRYAEERLRLCPFGPGKPTCLNCRVHCYKADRRQDVRTVMRHSGPRMLMRHPLLTLLHLYVDGRRAAPGRSSARRHDTSCAPS